MTAQQKQFVRSLDLKQVEERAREMYYEDTEGTRTLPPEWDGVPELIREEYRQIARIERDGREVN
jgi:hypothetical protein